MSNSKPFPLWLTAIITIIALAVAYYLDSKTKPHEKELEFHYQVDRVYNKTQKMLHQCANIRGRSE